MKSRFTKIISMALAIVLVFAVAPVSEFATTVSAATDYEASIATTINGVAGTIYDGDDVLLATATFTNKKTSGEYNVVMYAAQYENGILENVWSDTETVTAGNTGTLTCNFEGFTDRASSNIEIMLLDKTTLKPLTDVKKIRYDRSQTQTKLYLMGDSIVQAYSRSTYPYPIQGWGHFIGDYLNDNITVDNRAKSGWTTDHYLYPDAKGVSTADRNKVWSQILSELKPGDFILLSLGINDNSESQNISLEKYFKNLETIYTQADAKGATVILASPTIYGYPWTQQISNGGTYKYVQDKANRAAEMEKLAKKYDSVCLPLGASLVELYNGMIDDYAADYPNSTRLERQQYARGYFHIYSHIVKTPIADGGFGYDSSYSRADDVQHHNERASEDIALLILKLLKEADSPVADYIDYDAVAAHTSKTLHANGLCKVYDDVKPVK